MTTKPGEDSSPIRLLKIDRNRPSGVGARVGQALRLTLRNVRLESLTYEFSDHRLDIGPAQRYYEAKYYYS